MVTYKRSSPIIKRVIGCIACFMGIMIFNGGKVLAAQPDVMDVTRQAGYDVDDFYRPKSSIVIEAKTGKILWEDQPDLVRKIASMSKLMTILVALETVKEDQLNTELEVTEKEVKVANNYNLSNNHMVLGAKYTIRELFDLIIVPSSNAATLMLADYVADGDDVKFVQMMNDKAKEIGMTQTTFYNASGAVNSDFGEYMPKGIDPDGDNESTARDMAIMVQYLLNNHSIILEHTKNSKVTVRPGTEYEETFDTYLNSLPGTKYPYEGVDGLKTGSSPSAAFNYAATSNKNGMRLIEIIMGVGDWDHQECEYMRHPIGNAVLDYCYENYEYKQLLEKGPHTIEGKKLEVTAPLSDVVKKGMDAEFYLEQQKVKVVSDLQGVNEATTNKSGVTYTAIEQSKSATSQSKGKQVKPQHEKIKQAIILLAILLLLFVGVSGIMMRRRKKNRRQK